MTLFFRRNVLNYKLYQYAKAKSLRIAPEKEELHDIS